jgi:hypothetical protein
MTTKAINERLGGITFADVDTSALADDSQALTETPQSAQESPGTALQLLQHVMDAENRTAARLEALERSQQALAQETRQRLEPLEAKQPRTDMVFVALISLLIGLIIGFSVWWFQ